MAGAAPPGWLAPRHDGAGVSGAPARRHAAASILSLLASHDGFVHLQGCNPAQAFVSPGTLLLGAMLEHAAAEGRDEAHFLRGQ